MSTRHALGRDLVWLSLAVVALVFALRYGGSAHHERPRQLSAQQVAFLAAAPLVAALGNATSKDTIVVFSDYLCPYCALLYQDLFDEQSELALVLRHAPAATGESLSLEAAVAAECARLQGRFHTYSYALFSRRDSLGHLSWSHFGRVANVPDIERFQSCVTHRSTVAVVERDAALARHLRIGGTPTALYGVRVYRGLDAIRELLLEIRNQTSPAR